MIDDLFYGNVNPYERPITDDPELQSAMKVLTDLEENLCKKIDKAQSNAYATLNEQSMLRAFRDGFRVGFGIAEDLYRQKA